MLLSINPLHAWVSGNLSCKESTIMFVSTQQKLSARFLSPLICKCWMIHERASLVRFMMGKEKMSPWGSLNLGFYVWKMHEM